MDREGLRKILAEHERVVAPIVQRYHGRIVKNLGDSYMCLFESATDALRASMDIMHTVHDQGASPIHLGLNTGDVEEIDGDAFGEPVNMAARILGKAKEGEVLFGPGTYACMNAAEIPWEAAGRHALKGFPGETPIYRAVPTHSCSLPDAVLSAVRQHRLVRVRRGVPLPMVSAESIVLFEGFTAGSPALEQAVGALPVLAPASLYLQGYNISLSDRDAWTQLGRNLLIATPASLDTAIDSIARAPIARTSTYNNPNTLILEGGDFSPAVMLEMTGLALPAIGTTGSVPLAEVVESYSYDLAGDGRWMVKSDRAVLRIEVNAQGVSLSALASGITVDGRSISGGTTIQLSKRTVIRAGNFDYVFRSTEQSDPQGLKYAGYFTGGAGARLGVLDGQVVEMGREPGSPGLSFPDRQGQDNIRWCSGARAARAREARFTLDRALAGRKQCELRVTGAGLVLAPLHDRCPTYVRRDSRAIDSALERVDGPVQVHVGDLIVAGTSVVAVRAPEE